jgi:hypothetical protein
MKRTSKWLPEYSEKDYAVTDRLFESWIPAHEEIWLFGAGAYANAWRHYMGECGVNVSGFVVTSPECAEACTGEPIISIDDFKTRYRKHRIGIILTIDSNYYDEVLPLLLFAESDLYFLKEKHKALALSRFQVHRVQDNLMVACLITDHCNMACFSCDAAAPIAEERFASAGRVIEDFRKLRQIVGGDAVEHISIGGGEPLLHPRFLEIMEAVRSIFPDCPEINFYTNGLLLGEQNDDFYRRLAIAGITAMWTKYPIGYKDEALIYEKAKMHSLDLRMSPDMVYSPKRSGHMTFDESGKQRKWDYLYCMYHNFRIQLADGKLYTCPLMTTGDIVSQKFGVALPVGDKDSIDLHDVGSLAEILGFMRKRPKFCDYCAVRHRHTEKEWKPSKGGRAEWIFDETEDEGC